MKLAGTPSKPKENNGEAEECCSRGAGRVWIIGSCVFFHWSLAVVCTNYSLRAFRCPSADMLTDWRARGAAHTNALTAEARFHTAVLSTVCSLIHCQSSDGTYSPQTLIRSLWIPQECSYPCFFGAALVTFSTKPCNYMLFPPGYV